MNAEQMRARAERYWGSALAGDLREAADRIDAALALHVKDEHDDLTVLLPSTYCVTCGIRMPCPTRIALASESLNTGEPTFAVPGVANEGDA